MTEKGGFPDGPPPSEQPPPYTGGVANVGYASPQYPPQSYGVPQTQQYAMGQQTNVVVAQPMTSQQAVVGSVPDNMGLALFVTICCFWPLGIVAIMRASEARSAINRGDTHRAMQLSAEARRYSFWAIGLGIGALIVVIIIVVATVVSAYNNCYNNYYC